MATSTRSDITSGPNWALLAVPAGILGVFGMMSSVVDFQRADRRADPTAITNLVIDNATAVKVGAVTGIIAVACLVVFAAGVRRRLEQQQPAGSLWPALAWAGGLLTAAFLLVSFGLSLTMAWVIDQAYRDTTFEALHAITESNAFQAWAPLTLTAAAVAVAGIRHGAVAAWLGWFSALAAVAMATLTLAALPFVTWFPAAIWLVVAGLGLRLGGRHSRQA